MSMVRPVSLSTAHAISQLLEIREMAHPQKQAPIKSSATANTIDASKPEEKRAYFKQSDFPQISLQEAQRTCQRR